MPLPQDSLLALKFKTTPKEYADYLKAGGPVYWWERGKFFLVTGFKEAEIAMRSPEFSADRSAFFISRMPNMDLSLIGDFFGVVQKMMVMSDGPEHTRRRKVAALGLDDSRLEYFRPFIERSVTKLLDAAEGEQFDFVSNVARALPAVVLADLFAIEEKDRGDFYRWSNHMTQFFGGASQYRNQDGIEVNESTVSVRTYFEKLVESRMGSQADDFVSVLLRNLSKFGMDKPEAISQMIMMLVAGQITTTDQMCNNLYTLLTTPGAKERILENPGILPKAMEECNRVDPAVTYLFRVTTAPVVLGGVDIPAGSTVFVSTHAVNRDATVFENPDALVLDRKHNPHFAFGHGAHFCLGAKLARIEMEALFSELFKRFPGISLSEKKPAVRKHESLAFSGFSELPVNLETHRHNGLENAATISGNGSCFIHVEEAVGTVSGA